jgi:hypothetical protein
MLPPITRVRESRGFGVFFSVFRGKTPFLKKSRGLGFFEKLMGFGVFPENWWGLGFFRNFSREIVF